MFVFTVKSKKIKLFLLFFISIIAIIIGVSIFRSQHNSEEGIPEKYSTCAKTNEDRVNFLSQFGLQVNCEPLEKQKITIPETFNAVYEKYNEIQKKQGMDLEKYKGKACVRYTYQVLNYKNISEGVRANILVYNNKAIAGDICSVELGGFMHSFLEQTGTSNNSTEVKPSIAINNDEPIKSTFNPTLEPDPRMPNAPVD